jgi:hypothetical protein
MILYRILTSKFCCGIEIDNKGIIIKTAPILKKFKGQSIKNLEKWIKSINGEITKL